MNKFILKNGSGSLCCKGCGRQDNKLNTYDWLADIPGNSEEQDMVEVQFKNTRKDISKQQSPETGKRRYCCSRGQSGS